MVFSISGSKAAYMIYAKTDIGVKRKVNQDTVCYKTEHFSDQTAILIAVCDGVGGLQEGEIASRSCAACLKEWFEYEYVQIDKNDSEAMKCRMIRVLKEQNQVLYQYAQNKGVQLGTTVTAMVIANGYYYIVHVGDSRAYELGRKVLQLTEDQSFLAQEIKNGRITQEEAKTDSRKNIILQSIGSASSVEPVFTQGKVKKKASYLVCSDGFYKHLGESDLLLLAASSDVSHEIDKVIDLVKTRGEKDNISLVLAKCAIVTSPKAI